jgi:hypothetical protein
MARLDLRLRNLENSELLIASFESEDDAETWLADRPHMMEVIGLIAESSDPAMHLRLRQAARPLDADEAAVVRRMDEADAVARAEQAVEHARRAEAEAEAHREELRRADPDRPLQISWTPGGGFSMVDPADAREVTRAAQDAVLEWVRERDGWVADRGLTIGEAVVTVWPGPVPKGESRVQPGGRFVPVARAPAGST